MRILIAGCLLLAACRGEPGKPGNEAGPQQATATPVDDGKADCAIARTLAGHAIARSNGQARY